MKKILICSSVILALCYTSLSAATDVSGGTVDSLIDKMAKAEEHFAGQLVTQFDQWQANVVVQPVVKTVAKPKLAKANVKKHKAKKTKVSKLKTTKAIVKKRKAATVKVAAVKTKKVSLVKSKPKKVTKTKSVSHIKLAQKKITKPVVIKTKKHQKKVAKKIVVKPAKRIIAAKPKLKVKSIQLAENKYQAKQKKIKKYHHKDAPKTYYHHSPVTKTLKLFVNGGKLIPIHGNVKTIFIPTTEIADFAVKAPGLIYLTAKKVGSTELYGVDAKGRVLMKYRIEVNYDIPRLRRILSRFITNGSLKIEQVNGSLAIYGKVRTARQIEDIRRLAREFVARNYRGEIAGQNNQNIRDTDENDILLFVKVQQPSQVYLRVRLLEISREVNNTLGITWNAVYNGSHVSARTAFPLGNALGSAALGGLAGGGLNVDVLIDALAQEGMVTILSEPNLTTLSGESANFRAGGEFPIPVSQGAFGAVSVQFKQFGISLDFTPTVIEEDTINLKVRPVVSELSSNGAVKFNGISIPALVVREANTTVELRSGQSFAIAGLLQNNMNQIVSHYPGLAEIPVLGNLFRSREFKQRKTELVIVVTPYLVKPVSAHKKMQLPPKPYEKFDSMVSNMRTDQKYFAMNNGFLLE